MPVKETINKPLPNPNSINPNIKKNVENFGLRLCGLSDVQLTLEYFLFLKTFF